MAHVTRMNRTPLPTSSPIFDLGTCAPHSNLNCLLQNPHLLGAFVSFHLFTICPELFTLFQPLFLPKELLFISQGPARAFSAMKPSECPIPPGPRLPGNTCVIVLLALRYNHARVCLFCGAVNFEDRDCVFFFFGSQQPAQM